jgi:hypothetical protein
VTTIRREVLTLPATLPGPGNPLPTLRPLDEVHRIEDRDKAGMPRDMARQVEDAPLHSLLPVPVRDGYREAFAVLRLRSATTFPMRPPSS